MARREVLNAIVQSFQKLGGNLNDVLGTKTNISFLGKGKSPELMLDMNMPEEALAVLPRSKAVEELTSSVGYAVSGKLNDIQANKLLSNMKKMENFYFPPAIPKNITDFATRTGDLDKAGLMSLREAESMSYYNKPGFKTPKGMDPEDLREIAPEDLPPPGSRGGPDDIAAPTESDAATFTGAGLEAIKNVKGTNLIVDDIVDKIYLNAGVSKNAQPVARANARDFLNRIKDLEDPDFPSGTTLSSMMEADDFKFMTEGGGGGMGDPLLLVQKYFGPKVATAVAKLDSADDIQTFAERLVKIKDGRGRTITDRMFDPDSVDPSDFEFQDGGRVGFSNGGFNNEGSIFSINPDEAVKFNLDGEIINLNPNFFETFMGPFINDPEKFKRRTDDLKQVIRKNQKTVALADGGRVPFFVGGAARTGFQALRKYGFQGKDISRLFAGLGTDKKLFGKEKTEYFKQLNKVLKNPDDYPDAIKDLQKQLGIEVGIGFRSGGLAKILEV